MIESEIKELIKTISNDDTNDLVFRKTLSRFAPTKEIGMLLQDEGIDAKELVIILKTYLR